MGQLHELLAVEGQLKAEAERALSRARRLFTDGSGRLVGRLRHYRPLDEEGETFPDEEEILGTTVPQELSTIREAFGAWLDAALQKEITNQVTSADLVVGEAILAEDLPATAYLNLEAKLADLRRLLDAMPTTDPAEKWEFDREREPPCYVSKPKVNFRTQKQPVFEVVVEPTEHHPAQTHTYAKDVRVGEWETTLFSGMIMPSDKRKIMQRLDALQRAVKAARMRANEANVQGFEIADRLFGYIFQGVLD